MPHFPALWMEMDQKNFLKVMICYIPMLVSMQVFRCTLWTGDYLFEESSHKDTGQASHTNLTYFNLFCRQVKLGGEAPNSSVIHIAKGSDGSSSSWKSVGSKCGTKCHLLDFANSERPLVVNFGSATWPPFTSQLSAFSKLVEEFSGVADFLLVYIDEAHPSDGWAAPGISPTSFEVKKHRNQEDRCAAAHQLLERFSLPPQCQVVADCMDNNANVAYGVSFERVCIVQRQKIAYLGGKGPFFYNLQEVRLWLEQNFSKRWNPFSTEDMSTDVSL